jgi:release factor glutamine methyltransferase
MTQTLNQFLRQATEALRPVSPTPWLDAEVLVMQVTGLNRAALITGADKPLSNPHQLQLDELLKRRLTGEPVAYLTGQREFWSLELAVSPDVLIPRPETELLVEQALVRIPVEAAWTVADLGTGSGAVALAIASERPRCHVFATDTSVTALSVARANADRLRITNVEFRLGDWLAPLAGETVDVIVSNPPYVAENDPHLASGDVRFEPRCALVSGHDGFDAIRRIVPAATSQLRPGGWLILEHGYHQAAGVATLYQRNDFDEILLNLDLAGNARVTAGRRRP